MGQTEKEKERKRTEMERLWKRNYIKKIKNEEILRKKRTDINIEREKRKRKNRKITSLR